MLAVKRRMQPGRETSQELSHLEALYITGGLRPGWFRVDALWDYLDYNPGYIQANVRSYPNLTAVEREGQRLICSTVNSKGVDYLITLPLE